MSVGIGLTMGKNGLDDKAVNPSSMIGAKPLLKRRLSQTTCRRPKAIEQGRDGLFFSRGGKMGCGGASVPLGFLTPIETSENAREQVWEAVKAVVHHRVFKVASSGG